MTYYDLIFDKLRSSWPDAVTAGDIAEEFKDLVLKRKYNTDFVFNEKSLGTFLWRMKQQHLIITLPRRPVLLYMLAPIAHRPRGKYVR